MVETVILDDLIEKMESLFPKLSNDAVPLTLLVHGCFPKSLSREHVEGAFLARISLYNRLTELENEFNRIKELYSDDLTRSIRS